MTRKNRRFQRGSLYKRGKHKPVWVARWWECGTAADGSLERVRRSENIGAVRDLPTRRDAERVLAERLRSINSSDYRPRPCCTLNEYVQASWLPQVSSTLKYSTKTHYEYALRVHLLPAFGDMSLSMIDRGMVQRFLNEKLASGLALKTVRDIRMVLGKILSDAEFEELISNNPVRKTRLPRRCPVAEKAPIAPEKIRQLLEALPEPSRAIASLLVFTGLRVGELLALRWRDVDLTAGVLRVRRSVYDGHFDEPKTKRSNRSVPLGQKSIEILSQQPRQSADPDALIFATRLGTPYCRRNLLKRQLQPAAKQVGLKGINWHWLRHANATLLDSVGASLGTVQALLGHATAEVTREVYLHSVPADARKAVEGVEQRLLSAKSASIPKWERLATRLVQ